MIGIDGASGRFFVRGRGRGITLTHLFAPVRIRAVRVPGRRSLSVPGRSSLPVTVENTFAALCGGWKIDPVSLSPLTQGGTP